MSPRQVRIIVVVEDDAGMRGAIGQLLAAKGYETRVFPSAEAALAANHVTQADCFVLDIHLPGMSGHDLQDALAQRGSVAPVVLITAHDAVATRDRALRSGATFLAKPFQGRELLAIIEQLLPCAP